ncbi:MAG TPA: hypothetical protein VEA69_20990, partial [Tepidisphaeraceae bacterium]|nr:hypothetical protein [Tepidisphaeraceae bacterium]
KFRVQLVTPEQAHEWLQQNYKNRRLIKPYLRRYANDIRNGRWMLNGECLIFSDYGMLLNGQHRLHAIIETGIAIPLGIIEGVSSEAFITLDQQGKRTFAQNLEMDGYKNARTIAAAVSFVRVIESGVISARQMSIEDSFAVLGEHPGLVESAALIGPLCKRNIFEPGPFVAFYYLATTKHPGNTTAGIFFDRLFSGSNLEKGSPVYSLREQLIASAGSKRLRTIHKIAIAIKAFNATLTGKSLKFLKWAEDESFPEIL